jgi:hypothetical protein
MLDLGKRGRIMIHERGSDNPDTLVKYLIFSLGLKGIYVHLRIVDGYFILFILFSYWAHPLVG